MRTFVLLSFGLALVGTPVTAQTALGLRGGIGLATMALTNADNPDLENRTGLVAGVDLTFPVAGFLGLRFSGLYAEKGAKATLPFDDGSGSAGEVATTVKLNQAQLAMLARLGTPYSHDGFSIAVMAGPWAAYELSCDLEASTMGFELDASCSEGMFDFENLDYGVAVGAGVEFPLGGALHAGVDALYSFGLASLEEIDDTRTRHLALQGGVVIPLG